MELTLSILIITKVPSVECQDLDFFFSFTYIFLVSDAVNINYYKSTFSGVPGSVDSDQIKYMYDQSKDIVGYFQSGDREYQSSYQHLYRLGTWTKRVRQRFTANSGTSFHSPPLCFWSWEPCTNQIQVLQLHHQT